MQKFGWFLSLLLAAPACFASNICEREMREVATIWEPTKPKEHAAEVAQDLRLADPTVDQSSPGIEVYLFQDSSFHPDNHENALFNEIGRSRERVFRSVGEGSGGARDIDRFDALFHHLVAFDSKQNVLIGAYRMGLLDQLNKIGETGYTNTEFEYSRALQLALAKSGLEFGRSYIDREQGRSAAIGFHRIWRRIGKFLADNPRYRYLIGPVSISNTYSPAAVRIMVEYLRSNYAPRDRRLSATARPKYRFESHPTPAELALVRRLKSLNELNDVILEMDGKSIPPLFGIYADLGARYLDFAFDAEFNTIDGMILIDMYRMKDDLELRAHCEKFYLAPGIQRYLDGMCD